VGRSAGAGRLARHAARLPSHCVCQSAAVGQSSAITASHGVMPPAAPNKSWNQKKLACSLHQHAPCSIVLGALMPLPAAGRHRTPCERCNGPTRVLRGRPEQRGEQQRSGGW
jgi:hypothetical protein